jgi:hypothetical protein
MLNGSLLPNKHPFPFGKEQEDQQLLLALNISFIVWTNVIHEHSNH